jgi:hypothetical protein
VAGAGNLAARDELAEDDPYAFMFEDEDKNAD